MNTRLASLTAYCILSAVAAACTLFTGHVVAAGEDVIVAIPVNGRGLNLNQPADARELYSRLENAAYIACTRANRVGLAPSPDPAGCTQKALANAVRSSNAPLLTAAYLATHTLREAASHGIAPPLQLAANKYTSIP